jgi:hypothetical protein
MKILIAYDGSGSADAAIATAGELLAGSDLEAVVLTIWEPVQVAVLRATRFGSPMPTTDASDDDHHSKNRGQQTFHSRRAIRSSSGWTPPAACGRARRLSCG